MLVDPKLLEQTFQTARIAAESNADHMTEDNASDSDRARILRVQLLDGLNLGQRLVDLNRVATEYFVAARFGKRGYHAFSERPN